MSGELASWLTVWNLVTISIEINLDKFLYYDLYHTELIKQNFLKKSGKWNEWTYHSCPDLRIEDSQILGYGPENQTLTVKLQMTSLSFS